MSTTAEKTVIRVNSPHHANQQSEHVSVPTQPNKVPSAPPDTTHKHDADADGLELRPASGAFLIGVTLALLGGLGFGVFLGRANSAPTEPVAVEKPAEPVNENLVKLQESQMKSITVNPAEMQAFHGEKVTTGRIAFNDDKVTPVFSPYTGRILKLLAEPGVVVKRGDPLFEIDTPDLVQVESDLISAVSSLKNSQTALHLAQRNESIAAREIETGKRKFELSKLNEVRQKELYGEKAVALKDWEGAQRDAKQAEQDLEQGNKDLEQAQSDVKTAQSNIEANETVLNASRDRLRGVFGKSEDEIAKIEKTHLIDRNTRVLSPISGTITQRKCGIGEYISQNITDPLFMITDLSTVWMLADVYESDVSLLKLGLSVEVSVMAFPKDVFKAKITYISPSVDPNTHRIAVRCMVDNPGEKLKSDMFATFKIMTDDEVKSTAVPLTGIVRDGERKFVWVASGQDNQFLRREVATGLEQNGHVQIISGLKPEDKQIVAEGGVFLSNFGNAQ